ncbi:MAG: DUF389 domain-containing protein [Bacteroidales bacterium]|nr:DUF389 domain-containing protein [Bacteroidales bacterium]
MKMKNIVINPRKIFHFFAQLVSMKDDLNLPETASSIRSNVSFRGANVFILFFAVVIASVGLNVNSIPVIIGAMLISPVMGPILGFGFGLGTLDRDLVIDSLKNLAVMVGVSILASTLYFLLSPLSLENPTELLARTNPTVYDVLIAFFGGLAGILESSRKSKGTVLSGVAIATALMPPLSTVGYGIAIWNWSYVSGAFYLFIINSIFIALATFLGVKYLKYPAVSDTLGGKYRLKPGVVTFILLIIIIPSLISAFNIVRESNFKINAGKVVQENKTLGKGFIYNHKVDMTTKPASIELYFAGEALTPADRERLYASAEKYGITRSQLVVKDDASVSREFLSESEIIKNITSSNEKQQRALGDTIVSLRERLDAYQLKDMPVGNIAGELSAQYPAVIGLTLARGASYKMKEAVEGENPGQNPDSTLVSHPVLSEDDAIVALICLNAPLSEDDLGRISRWMAVRLGVKTVRVMVIE